MSPRTRSLLVSGVLLAALFGGGLAGGYVYAHEPARATLDVRVAADDTTPGGTASGMRTVGGTVTAIEGTRMKLTTPRGPVTFDVAVGIAVDELVRAPEGLTNGALVNVGVQSTQYGLVLTGLVAVEGAP